MDDLVVANRRGNAKVWVLLGNEDGTLVVSQGLALERSPQSVAAGDLDGDSNLDLVTANASSGTISILFGRGSGLFTSARNFAVDTSPESIAKRGWRTRPGGDQSWCKHGIRNISPPITT